MKFFGQGKVGQLGEKCPAKVCKSAPVEASPDFMRRLIEEFRLKGFDVCSDYSLKSFSAPTLIEPIEVGHRTLFARCDDRVHEASDGICYGEIDLQCRNAPSKRFDARIGVRNS